MSDEAIYYVDYIYNSNNININNIYEIADMEFPFFLLSTILEVLPLCQAECKELEIQDTFQVLTV